MESLTRTRGNTPPYVRNSLGIRGIGAKLPPSVENAKLEPSDHFDTHKHTHTQPMVVALPAAQFARGVIGNAGIREISQNPPYLSEEFFASSVYRQD